MAIYDSCTFGGGGGGGNELLGPGFKTLGFGFWFRVKGLGIRV